MRGVAIAVAFMITNTGAKATGNFSGRLGCWGIGWKRLFSGIIKVM